jgi:D-inositol-3-phosphate glycosyltransferase
MISAHSCPVGHLGTKDTGGMSVYIRELAKELGKLGHKVDVFTRVHDPRDPLTESMGRNVRLIHLRAGTNEEMNKLVLYSYLPDFACSLENYRKSRGFRYDLVFSHYWLSGQVGREVCQWWGIPHITMFHTLGITKNSLGIGEEEPELRIQTEGELAVECHRIIAPTGREKAALVEAYGIPSERIAVVPCGVNLRVFRPFTKETAIQKTGLPPEDGRKTILFVGRIDPLKGIDLLVRAFSRLRSQHVRLLVVGGDKQSQLEIDELQHLSSHLGISESVIFLGTVRHEIMPYYYGAADVCVISSYYESFGLVALESLACGTPVVATDVGDLKSIIRQGETGYVVEDRTPESLSDRITEVLNWPGHTEQVARLIRNSVVDFSWVNVASCIDIELRAVVADYLTPVHSLSPA